MTGLLPLASFTFEVPPTPAAKLGRKGTEKWIPLSKLRIDDSYQRPIDATGKKTIRGIIENFRWHKFAPLVVAARPGGLYAVVDGQHRAVACALHGGIGQVPCHVLACSAEEEAAAFATINGIVTRMQPQYLFRARIAAGDPKAVEANEAAKAAGVKIMPYPLQAHQLKVGETLSGKTIENEIGRVGREVVIAALELITRTGSGNSGLVRKEIIEGFCDVYHANPKWFLQQDEVRRIVNRRGVHEIHAEALRAKAEGTGTVRASIAGILSAALKESIGEGSEGKPVLTMREKARSEARRGIEPAHFVKGRKESAEGNIKNLRPTDFRRPSARIEKPKDRTSQDERALIEAHLAKHGARKFESGATGHTSNILDWLKLQGFQTCRRQATNRKPYVIDGKNYDLAGLFEFANKIRKKKGLEPLMLEKIKPKGRSRMPGLVSK